MSGPIRIVRKGGSMAFVFDRGDATVEGWICTISVKEFKADTSAITSRVIPLVNRTWPGFLTSAETDSIAVSKLYRLIAILTNATTNEEEQVVVRFNLTKAWA